MSLVKMPAAVICTFLWIGFVCAISFLESWLKFRAPGVTVPLGLGIGRLVFAALNKVEWVMAIAILLSFFLTKSDLFQTKNLTLFLPLVLLLLQTFWLLPALDLRAQMHIDGLVVPKSNLHIWFVAMEVIKTVCLTLFGLSLFSKPSLS